jgi:hypothetical protein
MNRASDLTNGGIPPTVITREDITYPTPEPCAYRFNPAAVRVLLEYAVNALEAKNPVRVLKVTRDWVSNGLIVYYEKEKLK